MQRLPQNYNAKPLYGFLPWLHFSGAVLAFVLIALFTAVHSELGLAISPGESPTFDWIGSHMAILLGCGLVYLVLTFLLQHRGIRSAAIPNARGIRILAGIEFLCIFILAAGFYYPWDAMIGFPHIVLLISILLQGMVTLRHDGVFNPATVFQLLQRNESRTGLFVFLLFVTGAILAYFDPSWDRMQAYIHLDTDFDYLLGRMFPPLLAGIVAVWLGIFTLLMLAGSRTIQTKLEKRSLSWKIGFYQPFFLLSGCYTALLIGTLVHAIYWEINKLNLNSAMLALFILTLAGGGILISRACLRIAALVSDVSSRSPAALVALSPGAIFLLPILKPLVRLCGGRWAWRWLLILVLLLSVVIAGFVLYGDFFNPWFTAFSYLKGAILKITTVVTAAALVLVVEEILPPASKPVSKTIKPWILMAIVFMLGFLPFGVLTRYPEAKAVILQFNEFCRVDTTYARELVNILGLGRWIPIGQNPGLNSNPHPWPHPWRLKKTHPSLLPADFNLLIIAVDALRGDAFKSAGYHRNLTPFLDRWALDEAISFRRAYSQGGGSFAALPFLVAGRSRFSLYGTDLYHENLFFKIARAEGIRHYMVMKDFGPRAIFPPDFPVMELAIPRTVSDRRSATADEVFDSVRKAVGELSQNERFFCFLPLMDVHNDLWKKAGGTDFGNSPRDLYDNNLSYLDRAFERFVGWLKQENIYDRTVILFTSDHGEQFWEHGASLHGHTLYEEEIRIPLILFAPGIQKRFDEVPVISADMAPTIADLAGYSVDPPYADFHMGISLVPMILRNEREPYLNRDVAGRASFKRRYFLYRNWVWKLVYFAELDLLQLFNVVRDPLEKNNLLEEEPELAGELQRELFDYLKKVEGKTYHWPVFKH